MKNTKEMKERFKNKLFIAALAAFIYQLLSEFGINPELGLYQMGVDILSYTLIGAGVYSKFNQPEAGEDEHTDGGDAQ